MEFETLKKGIRTEIIFGHDDKIYKLCEIKSSQDKTIIRFDLKNGDNTTKYILVDEELLLFEPDDFNFKKISNYIIEVDVKIKSELVVLEARKEKVELFLKRIRLNCLAISEINKEETIFLINMVRRYALCRFFRFNNMLGFEHKQRNVHGIDWSVNKPYLGD